MASNDNKVGSKPSSADDQDVLPEEVEATLEGFPDEAKRLVIQEFGMMGMGRISQESAIAKKINEEHIASYLEGSREQMRNSFKEHRENKIFAVILVTVALVFFTIMIVLLKDNTDVLEKIIYSVAGLIAGAFGGYGFGRHKGQDDD